MRMKKILAGLLAGALTVTSLTLASFADNEETSSFISVKGNTKWYAMNIDYEQTPIKKGTNTYTLSFTNEKDYTDSFGVSGTDKGALQIIFADLSENLKDITLDSVFVDDEEKNIGGDTTPETESYLWNGTSSPKVSHVITFTESQLENIGDIAVGSTLKITVSATYDVSAVQIGAANFKISQEKNEEMVKGDSFTLTYDSDSIPEESRYHLKYKIPKIDEPKNDSTDYNYYNIVYNNELNTDDAESAQEATGLKVTEATEGTKTIYTFTAVAPTSGKRPFAITAEASPKGDWSDTLYLWIGDVSIMVVDSDVPATSISLDITEKPLEVGDSVTLTATVEPDGATVEWTSSKEDVAAVKASADGKTCEVTAKAAGSATITATAGGVSATCEVTVTVPVVSVTGVTLDQKTLSLTKGGTATLEATVAPTNATDKTVTWATDKPAVATVENGKVTAVGGGEATITATAGDFTAECKVTVTVPVESVTIYQESQTVESLLLKVDGTATLTATVAPTDATDKTVTWTTDDATVATVKDGVVTAVGKGEAIITAKAGGKSATCKVTVIDPAKAITLPKDGISVLVGEEKAITYKVDPEDAEISNIKYTSSDENIFKVEDGNVIGVGKGEATLTMTAANEGQEKLEARCKVTVTDEAIAATAIKLSDTAIELEVDGTKTLTAELTPEGSTDKVTWSSSKEEVAVVDKATGKVTAKAVGEAIITAKANDTVSAECKVTVTAKTIAVTSVTLDKTAATVEEGETVQLTATVKPDEATNKTVTWSTSDETIATVKDGLVTAVKEGNATITAKAGTKTAECTITVNKKVIAIESVTLDKETAALEEGETVQLKATVNPEDTTEDKTVTWSSSDEKVATVKDGLVTAVKEGNATITAKAGTKSAECKITVTAKVSEGEGTVDPDKGLVIEVDDEDITIEADSDTFEDTVTVVKAEVSVSENVADEKTETIADAVKDILGGEESTVEVSAVISITLTDQDGNDVQPVDGGVVKITVPYDGKSNYAAYIDGDVAEFIKLVIDEAKKYASFDAKHFSDYYLVALSDEAADAIDKENGENDDNKGDDDNKDDDKNKVEKTYEGSIVVNDTAWWTEFEIALDKLIGEFAPEDVKSVEFTCANHGFQVGYNAASGWNQVEIAAGEKKVCTDIVLDKDKYALKVGISAGDGVDYTVSWVTTALVDGGSDDPKPDDPKPGDDDKNKVEKTYEGSIVVSDTAWWTEFEIALDDLIGEFAPEDVKSVEFTCANHDFQLGYNNTAGSWSQVGVKAGEKAVFTDIILVEGSYALKVGFSAGDGVDYTVSWVTTALVEDDGSDTPKPDENNINIAFQDKAYELKVVDATSWSGGEYTKAAQANIEVDLDGITYGTTTFGEIKNKTLTLSNIVYKNCGIEGVKASDIEVCIYMLHGETGSEQWVGSTAGRMTDTSVTWDLSTLAAARAVVPDSSPIQVIGYQINIKGSDVKAIEQMEIGATVVVNGESGNPSTPSTPSTPPGNFIVPVTSGSTSGDNTTEATSAPATAPAESEQAAPASTTEEDTSTNTTPPSVTVPDGGDNNAQATEANTPVPDDGNDGNVGNAGAGNAEDKNAATGVTLALIPVIAAAAGMIISKKRK